MMNVDGIYDCCGRYLPTWPILWMYETMHVIQIYVDSLRTLLDLCYVTWKDNLVNIWTLMWNVFTHKIILGWYVC